MKIDSKVGHIKQGREHMKEYSRIANELRIQRGQDVKNTPKKES